MCSSLAPRNFHHLIDYGARAESAACCSTAMTCTTLRATGNAFVWTHPIQQTHNAMQKESSMTSVQRVPKCVGPCQKVCGQVPLSTSRTQRRKAQPHAVMWPKTAVAKNCTAKKSQGFQAHSAVTPRAQQDRVRIHQQFQCSLRNGPPRPLCHCHQAYVRITTACGERNPHHRPQSLERQTLQHSRGSRPGPAARLADQARAEGGTRTRRLALPSRPPQNAPELASWDMGG